MSQGSKSSLRHRAKSSGSEVCFKLFLMFNIPGSALSLKVVRGGRRGRDRVRLSRFVPPHDSQLPEALQALFFNEETIP